MFQMCHKAFSQSISLKRHARTHIANFQPSFKEQVCSGIHADIYLYIYIVLSNSGANKSRTYNHSAGKHDRGPLFLHYIHLYSSEVVQLVQFKFKIF